MKRTTRRDTKVTPLVRSKSKQTEIHGAQAPEASPVPSSYETDAVGERSVSNDSLRAIPGMEPEVQRALEAQGIGTISQLLAQTTTKENRGVLAQSANIPIHHLKTLVDRADLLSLRGIRGDEAILLEEAGVTGCQDLHQRNPEHLYAILSQRHESGMAASFLPTRDQVTQWIAQAKTRATNVQRGQ